MRANRRDANEKGHIQIARQVGAYVQQQPPGQGFDLLVLYRGTAHIVEVKDPKQPPSKRQLTEDEQAMREQCETRGIPYHVVLFLADTLRVLGLRFDRGKIVEED